MRKQGTWTSEGEAVQAKGTAGIKAQVGRSLVDEQSRNEASVARAE